MKFNSSLEVSHIEDSVEVFIPTWNSARTIGECIECIRASIPRSRVILIDKFSSDGTTRIAQDSGAEVVSTPANLGEARTMMCNKAEGDYFVMVDSDTYLDKDWFENITKVRDHLNDEKVGIIQGLNEPQYERYRSWWLRQIELMRFPQVNPNRILTCNVLVRTEAVRGFQCDLPVYEDYAMTKYVNERGYNCYVTDQARAMHDNPTLESKDARWAGAGAVYTGAVPLWKFFLGIFWGGFLKSSWGWKWYSAKLYFNWFWGGLFLKKHLKAKR